MAAGRFAFFSVTASSANLTIVNGKPGISRLAISIFNRIDNRI